MGSVYNRGTKSSPSWWVKYKDENGRWRPIASNQPTKDAAKVFVASIEARIKNGMVGIVEKTPQQIACATITLRKLEERFSAEYAPPRIKDVAAYRKQTRTVFDVRILPTLGDRPAASISSLDVEQLRDKLLAPIVDVRDGYAPRSVEWTMARLSKVYVWGRKVGAIDCVSPVAGVEYPRGESSLDFLSHAETAALLTYTEEHRPDFHAMVATAVYAGLRKGELYGLRWPDVNLDRSQLTVARSYTLAPKSGKARHLPLNPRLVRVLRAWQDRCPKTDDALVFPVGDVALGWRMGNRSEMLGLPTVLKLAGCHVPKKAWHALRHTFASHFMMAGNSILTLQKLLGHAALDMTLIYAHLAPDFMGGEVAKMSFEQKKGGVANLDDERTKREQLGTPVVQFPNAANSTT